MQFVEVNPTKGKPSSVRVVRLTEQKSAHILRFIGCGQNQQIKSEVHHQIKSCRKRLRPGIVSKKSKETHKSKRSTISGSSSSSSEDSSTSSTSKATTSSKSSAKAKLAVLEARLNAQKEIDKLNEKHARERLDFEEELIRQKHAQAEAVALAEKQQFELQRLREEKELLYQQKLTQAHLEAQLKEAIAELTAHQSSSTASNAERSQRLIANTDTPYSMTSCENSSPQQTVSTILQSDN